jgi:ribosomal protein S26
MLSPVLYDIWDSIVASSELDLKTRSINASYCKFIFQHLNYCILKSMLAIYIMAIRSRNENKFKQSIDQKFQSNFSN